jgi:hypothetical protein
MTTLPLQPLTEEQRSAEMRRWNCAPDALAFSQLDEWQKIERAFFDGISAAERAHGIGTEQPVHQAVPVDVASATSRALEFAEYMAKAADNYIDSIDAEDIAREAWMNAEPAHKPLAWDRLHAAESDRAEYARTLRSRIYEFRKRAEKVANKGTA